MLLKYDEFIKYFCNKNIVFCKYLDNDFQYNIGINEDNASFKYSRKSFKSGGLHFTTVDNLHKFTPIQINIAIIKLCEDALFYIDSTSNGFKTNKFNIIKIVQLDEICKIVANRNCFESEYLEHINHQTIKSCGICLKYVKNQTDEICKLAVRQDGTALQYVKEQTNEICELAIKQDPFALIYVKNPTINTFLLAAKHCGCALHDLKYSNIRLCDK